MHAISGTTKLAGVIGHPVARSLSPAMHNAVYEHLMLDWAYVPLDVADETGLRRLVAAIQSMRFVGFNVTMPFKQQIVELCDEVSMGASLAGAVNTVHLVEGRMVGYNTDGRGLLEALETEAGFSVAGKHVVLLGAGGAAGGAIVAFILARAGSVTIVNRNGDRAEELIHRIMPHLGGACARWMSYAEAEQAVRDADLIVNATSVGMKEGDPSPLPATWLGPGHVVFDMVYGTPGPTALVREARAAGAVALDGLGMLVCQGAMAVDIWNESKQVRTPREVMRAAAEAALAARATHG